MYLYIKALHIIFVVTWFAGLFYMPRLLIYTAEAQEKNLDDKNTWIEQLKLMQRRLWYGITWPSAIVTLIFGCSLLYLFGSLPNWLIVKLIFVVGLYCYQIFTHVIFRQQQKDIFKYSSFQLRIWNEIATIFLVAIVFLVVVKDTLVWAKALGALVIFILILLLAINVYKKMRQGQ